jgi:hypothetical protein
MSRKLVTIIQDIKGLPGKYKRVLQAWASFANNDGTNIFASKESVAERAGVTRWTVYENTDALEAAGVLLRASRHICRTEKCNKGGTHFTSQHGHYTTVYRIDVALLQNPTVLLQKLGDLTVVKPRKHTVENSRKGTVAKPDATQALKETPAPLGTEQDSSALTSGSEKAIKPESPSLAGLATAPPAPSPASPESQSLTGFGVLADQNQNQPQEQWWQKPEGMLLIQITPGEVPDAGFEENMSRCREILGYFEHARQYSVVASVCVLKWNRAHRSGKYASKDDKKLYIRSAKQYLKALQSDTASLVNDYALHEFAHCEVCKEHGLLHYDDVIGEMIEKDRAEEERRVREAEEARLAKLCQQCKVNAPGSMALVGHLNHTVRVCDACYDKEYEKRQNGFYGLRTNIIEARPGYLEAKRKAERLAEIEANEIDVEICAQCGKADGHMRSCPTRQAKTHEATA